MSKRLIAILAVVGLFLGLTVGGGVALAVQSVSAPVVTTTINACVKNSTHAIYKRVGAHCATGATALSWNVRGLTGATGPAGAVGPQGPAGAAGRNLTLPFASATTSVSNRNDSGNHGNWAKDTFVRSATITRQAAATAAHCGGGAIKCFLYTGSIVDSGTFRSVAGANSPEAGTVINGVVTGPFSGGSAIEFYASSDTPDGSLVNPTQANEHSTSDWAQQFFPAGTHFSTARLLDWKWTYGPSATCETWVNAVTGDTGDIKGVNACP